MAVLEATATVTSKGQFTLPKPIREALGLTTGERVICTLDTVKGEIMQVRKQTPDHEDPAIAAFLGLLEKDIAAGELYALPPDLENRMRIAAAEDIDLDENIEGDVAL